MEKLYYLETKGDLEKAVSVLKEHGLHTEWFENEWESHWSFRKGHFVMWNESAKYPCYVWQAQIETVKACGIRVDY